MPCLVPIVIKHEVKGTHIKKGEVVPCGKCAGCIIMKRNAWTFRLLEQEKSAKSSYFITLTYDENNIPIYDLETGTVSKGKKILFASTTPVKNETLTLWKKDLQNYFKRVRKNSKLENLKYYAVGEYGKKSNRPHYHAIVFNANKETLETSWATFQQKTKKKTKIGHVHVGQVTLASIHYVTGYIINKMEFGYKKGQKPFALISNGIGQDYIKKGKKYHKDKMSDTVVYPGGIKQKMPRYIKNKIFNEKEREEIGIKNKEEAKKQYKDFTYEDYMNRNKSIRLKTKSKSNKI